LSSEPQNAAQLLRTFFGFESFRSSQEEVINATLANKDVSVIKPTGSGKSICYQIPAMMLRGVGVVISPLIALMKDQVDGLRQSGVSARFLNSSLSAADQQQVENEALAGKLDLLYIAPERLARNGFLSFLRQIDISLFAIDEAHCVSQWGHDFRPDYLQIARTLELFPDTPRAAFTATADAVVSKDIADKLHLRNPVSFLESFDRPNIQYRVEIKQPKSNHRLLNFIQSEFPGESGIIYVGTRKRTHKIADWLNENGVRAIPYHAGLPREEKDHNQELFNSDQVEIIVATIAFGMGIDKPDIRFVIHLDLPKNVESYYQETGRAGRDGNPAIAWMQYSLSDVIRTRTMIESNEATDQHKSLQIKKLYKLLGYCESLQCRRKLLLEYFGEQRDGECGNCDTCLETPEKWDGTVAFQKALSVIYRTEERFGVEYLIKILAGETTERMLTFGHEQLPTFGCGTELSAAEWRSVFRQLLVTGHLDSTEYSGLAISQQGLAALKKKNQIFFRKDIISVEKKPSRRKSSAAAKAANLSQSDEALFQLLRQYRSQKAAAKSIAPYQVFHDKTLIELAMIRPDNLEQLKSVHGIGNTKIVRYGQEIIDVIASFVAEK
jgi:ATP-dependent DNA helicase RecQ